jgi:peptidoglycan/xylan/chitin deacetylase (PgdA/CDA1 family)
MLSTLVVLLLAAGTTAAPIAGSTLGEFRRPPPPAAPPPELVGRTVVLSVDDGYHTVFTNIYPLLRRYRMPMTLGVIGNYLRGGSPAYNPSAGFMRKSEIREMLDSCAIEIASHSLSHPFLTRLDSTTAWREIRASKLALESLFGEEVVTFVYPYGDLDDRTVRMVRAAGYRMGRAVRPGRVDLATDPWRLPIVELRIDTDIETIKRVIATRPVTILLIHQVVAEPRAFTQWRLDDFERLLDWLDSGGARVTTLRRLYQESSLARMGRMMEDIAAAFPDTRKQLLFENVEIDATQAPHPR